MGVTVPGAPAEGERDELQLLDGRKVKLLLWAEKGRGAIDFVMKVRGIGFRRRSNGSNRASVPAAPRHPHRKAPGDPQGKGEQQGQHPEIKAHRKLVIVAVHRRASVHGLLEAKVLMCRRF